MRLIDADKLMAAIDKDAEMHTLDGDTYVSYADVYHHIKYMREEAMYDKAGKWIAFKDSTPPLGTWLLVKLKGQWTVSNYILARMEDDGDGYYLDADGNDYEFDEADYWMDLEVFDKAD